MFKYTPNQMPSKIMVIGCGGTGSRLVPLLAQFLRSITRDINPAGWLVAPTIYLVDFDTVEQKNLMRQNFIEADVGKHKAAVLAQRYGRAYGVNMIPILSKIENSTTFHDLARESKDNSLNGSGMMTIMCVDSSSARRSILSLLSKITAKTEFSPFVIDAGNENNYGQVKFFHMTTLYGRRNAIKGLTLPKMLPVVVNTPFIPYPYEFYQNLEDAPSQGSCADLDQTLAINAAMATTIIGVVQNFFYVKPFTHNEISISLDGAGYTTFNTANNFIDRCCEHYFSAGYFLAEDFIKNYIRENNREIQRMEREVRLAQEIAEAEKRAKAEKAVEESKAADITKKCSINPDGELIEIKETIEKIKPARYSKKKPVELEPIMEAMPRADAPALERVPTRPVPNF